MTEEIAFLRVWGLAAGGGHAAGKHSSSGNRTSIRALREAAEEQLGRPFFEIGTEGDGGELAAAQDLDALSASVFVRIDQWPIASDVSAPRPGIPGQVHEHLLARHLLRDNKGKWKIGKASTARKAAGVVYTPIYIAEYMAALSAQRSAQRGQVQFPDSWTCPHFLDPACGCGVFLLAALDVLCREFGLERAGEFVSRLHGIDLAPPAVLAARRSLLLAGLGMSNPRGISVRDMADTIARNIRCADAMADEMLNHGAEYDVVLGNPPYRRELGTKSLLDQIACGSLGRYREPRMDLWYFFVHRGLELLKPGGILSFIVGAYWTSARGAKTLIAHLRDSCHVEEIFLLGGAKVFPGVAGKHLILTLTKGSGGGPTRIKRAAAEQTDDPEGLFRGRVEVESYWKEPEQLFRENHLDLDPVATEPLLGNVPACVPLSNLGLVRQGIAENPASVTRKTNERYGECWSAGEGVFVLSRDEVERLDLGEEDRRLLRPYHDLCDLGRYWLATEPSRLVIYSTAQTCPEIDFCPGIRRHLASFRRIMEARRETLAGIRGWWQLHWPREESLWTRPKILSVQMGRRPAFVPAPRPVYVPFSVNVFVPHEATREHLNYFAAVLNSNLLYRWFVRNAKHRGVGLEINGHVLARMPFRRIDFNRPDDVDRHDRLVVLVEQMLEWERQLREHGDRNRTAEIRIEQERLDGEIDGLVEDLYSATHPADVATDLEQPLAATGQIRRQKE